MPPQTPDLQVTARRLPRPWGPSTEALSQIAIVLGLLFVAASIADIVLVRQKRDFAAGLEGACTALEMDLKATYGAGDPDFTLQERIELRALKIGEFVRSLEDRPWPRRDRDLLRTMTDAARTIHEERMIQGGDGSVPSADERAPSRQRETLAVRRFDDAAAAFGLRRCGSETFNEYLPYYGP